ncbi:PrsW family intramembrane metalloprotease [Candidatus Parcubacteria bacterium]|nr:PrsW family intramembrane metalloprotease [Patescibacteria group bacterium]MBU4466787.1 PrsW family intramembrane metalloprotease [Patescibacteria group bacterium]MCG2688810.1 PrsW family intramembrane metalloprotease [Candidatus Parcubacteria bacterium]
MANYLFLIIFGLAPSIIWLLYFLRRDSHPENNFQVFKIFIYGALAVLPAALIQFGIFEAVEFIQPSTIKTFLMMFFGVALIEELLKYLVVRDKIMRSPHFDEPMDLPLYMIISALGFAAIENILAIVGPSPISLSLEKTIMISFFRFVSAVFLHALASGTFGFFAALAVYKPKKRKKLLLTGFLIAVFLHALYNFSIMVIEGSARFLIPFLILTNLALVLSLGFKKLKEIKSICKI